MIQHLHSRSCQAIIIPVANPTICKDNLRARRCGQESQAKLKRKGPNGPFLRISPLHHPPHAIPLARQVADVLHALDIVRRDAQLLTQVVFDQLRHPLRGVFTLAHVLRDCPRQAVLPALFGRRVLPQQIVHVLPEREDILKCHAPTLHSVPLRARPCVGGQPQPHALDAQVLSEDAGGWLISAEVFGKGIEMWLRSQGEWVERLP